MNNRYLDTLQDWEYSLGASTDNSHVLSSVYIGNLEDRKGWSSKLRSQLIEIGYHLSILPPEWKGARSSWLYAWLISSLTTRRTISAMPSVLYSQGPISLLELVGDERQRRFIAGLVRGGEQVCFAMTESETGSNLLGISTTASRCDNGWIINGRKAVIGLPANATYAIVLAKTAEAGPASLSFFLVKIKDNEQVERQYLPTRGMQEQEFARLTFNHCYVSTEALVAEEGRAFEAALKVQQYVKFMSTAASHGGCHNLIRHVMTYAEERKLNQYSHTRLLLCKAFASLYLLEACVFSAASMLSLPRKQFSMAASVCKAIAINVSDEIMGIARTILCSNFVVDNHPICSLVKKITDDLEMVRAIDINPVLNLHNLTSQLSAVHSKINKMSDDRKVKVLNHVIELLNIDRTCMHSTEINTSVTNIDGDYLLSAIMILPDQLVNLVNEEYLKQFKELCEKLLSSLELFWRRFSAINESLNCAQSRSAARLEMTNTFTQIYGASAIMLLWIANQEYLSRHIDVRTVFWLLEERISGDTTNSFNFDDVYSHLYDAIEKGKSLSWLDINVI